jgi:hypothetical protein
LAGKKAPRSIPGATASGDASRTGTEGTRGPCASCGGETVYAWVDTRCPGDNAIPMCISCMNWATVTGWVDGKSRPLLKKRGDE